VKQVILDQRPASGQVWIRVVWQTGAVSEHKIRRNVNSYRDYADIATLESRVRHPASGESAKVWYRRVSPGASRPAKVP
jgi:hypothetical protein